MSRIAGMVVATASLFISVAESKPIGSVSSRGAVQVAGTILDIAEVPSWPIVAGDVIQTRTEPATILLDDGTRLVLEPSSTVTLTVTEPPGKLLVTLAAGGVTYNVSKNSSVTLLVGKQRTLLEAGASGTATIDGKRTAQRDDRSRRSTPRQTHRRPVLSPHEP